MNYIIMGEVTIVLNEDPEGPYVLTEFPDGHEVLARPIPWEEHHAFTDPWTQCWTHEVLHSVWAQAQGLPWSPALRFAAVGSDSEEELDRIREEESTVLAMQQLMAATI